MVKHTEQDAHPFNERRDRRTEQRDRTRKRRRWPWVLLLLLVVIFFLPNVIAMTSLKQRAIDYALSDFKGQVTAESVSIGWLQPIVLTSVQAVDEQGQPLATIEELKTTRSLVGFLASSDFGIIEINQPAVWVQLRPDGSNLEDACAEWLQSSSEPNPAAGGVSSVASDDLRLPKVQVKINNGVVAVFSPSESKSWQVEQLNIDAQTQHELACVMANTTCQVTVYEAPVGQQPVAQMSGSVAASIQVDPGSPMLTGQAVAAEIQTDSLPLSVAGPLLQRSLGPTRTDGTLTADLQAAYDTAAGQIRLSVKQAEIVDLSISSPYQFGDDELQVTNVTASGNVTIDPSLVTAEQFHVAGDFANVSVDGTLDLNHLSSLANTDSKSNEQALLNTPFQLSGEIDLAGVAAAFPATLHLHDGLAIESGAMNFQAASRVESDIRRLIINVDTANLVARKDGKPIVWQKPLRVVGAIRESAAGLVLEELLCESDFLTVNGTATVESGSFATSGDLSRLMQRVGQFVDVGETQLSGDLDGKLAWQTNPSSDSVSPSRPVQVVGEFTVERPQVQLPGMAAWQRPQLTARISAAGESKAGHALHLNQGGVQIDVGTEQAIVTLAEPVANAVSNSLWKFNAQLTGSAAGWLAHINNFVDFGPIQVDGKIRGQAIVHATSQAIEIHRAEYEIEQFRFSGYGLTIREEQTNGTANARYDLATGQLQIADTSLSSNSISLGGQQIAVDTNEPVRIDGDLAFLADVNRVADWVGLSPSRDSVFWFGTSEGTVRFSSDSNGIGAQLLTSAKDLVAATRQTAAEQGGRVVRSDSGVQSVSSATPWVELWREAVVNLNADIVMSNDFESIAFKNASLESSTMKANVAGQVSDLSGSMLADMRGTWSPDWQKLNALLGAYTGKLVQMSGRGAHPISLQGPLFEPTVTSELSPQSAPWVSPLLTAATSFGWQQASVAGVPIGEGQVKVDLQDGVANVGTNKISFSQGTIQLQPQVDLRGSDPVLYLPAGNVINRVALTPETARNWLKFVAPLAADATSAQGNFSLSTKGAQVPLMDPMKMRAEGELILSNVVIGAGPTSEKLIATAQQIHKMLDPRAVEETRDLKTWLTMEEQTVPVAVHDGRVFHEGVKISHKDIIIRTRGSVGMDQSLDLVAEIPIVDDWIDGKKHLSALRGQKISIPVSGTASAPKLDLSAVNQISGQLLKQAATGEINKFLGDKVAPKVTEYQNEINDRVGKEVNKLQGKLQNKLFNKLTPQSGGQPNESPDEKLKDELIKGFGNLFGN